MNTDLHSLENMEMEGIDDGEDRSFFVRALYDFHSTETSSLSFKKGTLIEVLTQLESGWWDGLLGNDVRGWFPSNYVERISDEEAEAEFQSQQDFADLTRDDDSNDFMNTRFNPTSEVHENGTDDFLTQQREEEALKNALQNNASKSVGAQYSGLGLGQDFNTLRRLMDGVGSNENDETDAFEQLAEATMISNASQAVPNAINGHSTIVNDARDERLGVIDARRRSRMSDQSSILGSLATSNGTTYSNISQTDISSMKTRSNAASFSDAEYARKVALSTAESSRNALDAQEKERNRAHTVSGPEGQQQDQQSLLQQLAGRPRAQTAHAGMTSSSSAASSGGSQTTGAFTPSRKNSKMFNNESDSFWIPKVNEEGEIYYFNTQTGQQSRDLPQGAESGYDNDLSSSEQLNSGDAQNIRRSGTPGNRRNTPSTMRRNRSHQSGPSNVTISSDASDSRPTSSSSLHTAATRQSKIINTIDKMPESNQVPFPWIVRTSDDERTFYFYNRQTHEISHDTEAVLTHSLTNYTHNEDQRTVRVSGRKLSDTTSSSSRFGRNSSGGLQQNYKRPGHHLRYRSADQADTFSYQESLSNDQAIVDLRTMIDKTGDAIAILASMASEEIGEDGLSQLDARALGENQNSLKDESRLSIAISNVVENICRLLRTAGALNISPIDLLNAAETVHMNQDYPNESEALHGFQHSISSLQGRSLNVHESSESDLFVTAAGFNAIPTPPASLLPLGKKINATLSKLVLSARSVVEQSCLNAVERPSFTQAQLEKILSYRNRIKDDSMELARALGVFSNEIAQPSAFGRSNGYSTQRKQNAYLRSGKADSGIGLNVFGGGSAAGWRGNGFVLPSAKEAAALSAKAQMPETHLQDLTKEAKKAVSSGSIALRRKPTLALSREILEGTITTKFAHYAEVLSELRLLLIAKENEEQKKISAQNVIFTSTKVLRHFGALISWIEEIDLASGLDVDGPALDDTKALSSEGEDYHDLVITTRQTLHRFGNVKQAAFDACQMLLICVQDRTMNPFVLPEHLRTFSINEETIKLVDKLGFTAVQLQSLLAELLHLSETQLKFGFSSMGGRAKVHGIADVKMKMVEDKVVKVNQSLDGQSKMISTNNNLATPVTPTVSSSASSSTAMAGPTSVMVSPTQVSDAKTNSVPSSSLKAMFQRARSTSVATGASATSNDSSRLAAGQEDVEGVRGSSRFRRDTVDGQSSINVPSAPGSSTGDHMGGDGSLKQAEEIPWFLQPDTPPEDIILNPNGQVKGATLSALMERLTMHNAFDSSFNSTFLMTYRSFTSTDELLDLLFARFRIQEPAGLTLDEHELWIEKKQRPIRFRVFNVLKSWLEGQFHENENEMHMKRVRDFALDEMAHSPAMAMPANLLLRIIERRSGTGEQMKITMVMPSSAPPPILPKNFRKIKFLDIDPLEMARQLTLMDSRLYNRIRPAECLGKAWSREDGASKAKGVRDVIGANNRVSGWVSEAILVQEDVKKRAAWVKQFVAIADRCFYLNNFSSMMAIYSGLNNASLNRLRRTWDAVNQRHLQLFDNMRAILAPTRNFTRYRETLRKLNPPCVPFLGVYLTDLTFIEDGNTDRLRTDDRLINFSKRQMTAEKIQEIMIYQSTPYNLTPVPGIQKFIEENLIDARTDDELFEQSLRLEPREREDEKIARLLQESGFL